MIAVRFNQDRDVKNHLGVVIQSFRTGDVVELSEASARRWISRGIAERVKDGQAPDPPTVEKSDGKSARPTQGDNGPSPGSGPDQPSSASQAGPVSLTGNSNESGLPGKPDDAASSQSTEVGSEPDGPTSSTEPTRRGSGKRKTSRGSRGGRSASKA